MKQKINILKKYFKVWRQLSICAISSFFSNRIDSWTYFLGKVVRFGFFLFLIFSIFNFTDNLAGYSKYEVILFFLTFNLLDVIPQAFFRGIYLFQDDVKKGNFDYIISKPINPLFYSLSRLTDILDFFFLIPIIAILLFVFFQLRAEITLVGLAFYFLFILLGLVTSLGISIISACISVWTMESENFIWVYRESMTIGRFPPEIFSSSIRWFFTLAMPIIIIVAFPVKSFLMLLSWKWIIFGIIYSILFFIFSLWLWKVSLKRYQSASS